MGGRSWGRPGGVEPPPGESEGMEPGGGGSEGAKGARKGGAELGLEAEDNDCRYLLSHLFTFILLKSSIFCNMTSSCWPEARQSCLKLSPLNSIKITLR